MAEEPAAGARRLRTAGYISAIGAVFVLAMGLIHFPMAYGLVSEPSYQALGPAAMDLLILLCLCVGILLVFVGVLSLVFARRLRAGNAAARVFFVGMGGLFLARTVLELMFPVAVPEPDVRVLVWVFATSVVFFAAALVGQPRPRAA